MNDLFQECRELELINQFAPVTQPGGRAWHEKTASKKSLLETVENLRWDIGQIETGYGPDGDYNLQIQGALLRLDILEDKIKAL